jgi:hypothetical protein
MQRDETGPGRLPPARTLNPQQDFAARVCAFDEFETSLGPGLPASGRSLDHDLHPDRPDVDLDAVDLQAQRFAQRGAQPDHRRQLRAVPTSGSAPNGATVTGPTANPGHA